MPQAIIDVAKNFDTGTPLSLRLSIKYMHNVTHDTIAIAGNLNGSYRICRIIQNFNFYFSLGY